MPLGSMVLHVWRQILHKGIVANKVLTNVALVLMFRLARKE